MPIGNPNGYGQVFSAAMAKPMFPGASGYGGSITVGDRARARQAAQGQSGRNVAQARRMNQPAGTGYGSLVTTGQAKAQSQVRSGSHTAPPRRAVKARPKTGGQYDRPRAAGAGAGAVDNVVAKAEGSKMRALLKGKGRGLAIGAGAAVIGGLAYSGRRGEGSSGGRTGMTRY